MKTLNEKEMRTVDGGYRLKCKHCGKKSGSVGPVGSTLFYANHQHYGWGEVVFDTSYKNASKWYS